MGRPLLIDARGARTGAILAVTVLVLLAAQYLAAVLLLVSLHLSPKTASPLTLARYLYYHGDRPEIRRRVWWCSGIGIVVIGTASVAVLLPKPPSLHGDARLATQGEIARHGLFGERGILLGKVGRRYLALDGQQGVCLAAPPRSGKGVGLVIPNLLHWPASVVCTDIKKENWLLTAGYRRECGQECYLFDPLSEEGATARWNPLGYVSDAPAARINDLQRIADMLYLETPGTDPFWIASARSLFVGICLYLFETPGVPRTIGEVLRQGMASDAEGFGAHWRRVVEARASGRIPLSSECVRALYDVIDLAPVTASSVRKTFTSRLDLWQNPLLDAATATNDFDLRALRRRPMSLYVGVNPDDLHRLRPLLSLFFQQTLGLQTHALPEHDSTLRYPVLMLLDEFAALGRIPIIAEAVSYLPGYGVRTVLVVQALAQLKEVYGEHNAETMMASLAARVVYAPKDLKDAKEISDLLGSTTVKTRSVSRPRFGFKTHREAGSVSVSEQRRPLRLPQEVRALEKEQQLIFLEGLHPILCQKIRYYCDNNFRDRLRPPLSQPRISAAECPAGTSDWASTTSEPSDPRPLTPQMKEEVIAEAAEQITITPPEGESWTEPELQAAVETFLQSFADAR